MIIELIVSSYYPTFQVEQKGPLIFEATFSSSLSTPPKKKIDRKK
jgi:hypothetical protein